MKYVDYSIHGLILFLSVGCVYMSITEFDGKLSILAIIGGVLGIFISCGGFYFAKRYYN